MNVPLPVAAESAAALPLFVSQSTPDVGSALFAAATALAQPLSQGLTLEARSLRAAMEAAFGGSDADGSWSWKLAYDACEAAQVLFLRRFNNAMRERARSPAAFLSMLARIAALVPSQTRRSEESQTRQQFSTPLPLAFVASAAAGIGAPDIVLEPSAGTGLLGIFAELTDARLVLNELAETRASLLGALFPLAPATRHDAAHIHDHLPASVRPTAVLMNPPFSTAAHVDGRVADAALRHVTSALARLCERGRIVAITGAGLSPDTPTWRDAFVHLQKRGRVVFSAAIEGHVYARHGTNVATRLTVIDRVPADDPAVFPPSPGMATDPAMLLDWVLRLVPRRSALAGVAVAAATPAAPPHAASPRVRSFAPRRDSVPTTIPLDTVQLAHEASDWSPPEGDQITAVLYESYVLQSIRIPGARPHPTRPVQSAAMASVAPPKPCYRPHLPRDLVSQALLSEAQLESVIYAGESHSEYLAGSWTVDETFDVVTAAPDNADNAVRFRRGWFLGEGILFTTYATIRSASREARASRLEQIIDWLGRDFDGVIVFDESHAMANAAGTTSERGDRVPSQQGRAGLRLQHALPDARVIYVSATGATTVHNLAYAQRLGLWGGVDFPFATRAEFVQAIEAGGVAAMEVLARDLKALGLYTARSLSYEGIEYELVEHRLTAEQVRIYASYAGAFQVIHNNLTAALEAANVTGSAGTLNAQAKAAARSAFESAKQRFFNHLITAMKTPSLVASIERDLAAGHAAVVQIVSTGEALMERRLAEIPSDEWNDITIDITPREYVLDYLAHAFPTQLYEPYTDGEGNLSSRPVYVDGQPVQCRDAVERRDCMVERLAALTPVPGALDQIVQRFGTDGVAEVTGRSRRIVRIRGSDGSDRFVVVNRAPSANLAEAQAFMDDEKRILVFSDAGGTGRSYHADLAVRNRRLRVHYLLEPGWKADAAIQGLGRTNRTNQAQPPLFRPIATDVKAEKRFLSTIARRLDSLGAITRGQRQTGGQGLFRADDNLESTYARAALRQFYSLLYAGKVDGCSLLEFEEVTGLALTDADGTLREELPPITTFLNRLLALTIDLQNTLFAVFEQLLPARIEDAVAAGSYDAGVERLTAESLRVIDRRTVYTHEATGAETQVFIVERHDRNKPLALADALEQASDPSTALLVNKQSGRAAVRLRAPSVMRDDGEVERRVRLLRPMERMSVSVDALAQTHWREVDRDAFAAAWQAEVAFVDEFSVSRLHMVTGLLLPIWRRLPEGSCKVYRLQTDDGERVIGRLVPATWIAQVVDAAVPPLSPDEAWCALLEGDVRLDLADGMQLRRVTVMSAVRVELTGFTDGMVERLKAKGLLSEIIAWRLRLFVPTGSQGPTVLAALLERYRLTRISERPAA